MDSGEAQLEMRTPFAGGFYGQLVSGILWVASAGLATWSTPRAAITTLVVGGFFIVPVTELLIRVVATEGPLSAANSLRHLGMQVAFGLPFVSLYGMRIFAALAALVVGGGWVVAMYGSDSVSVGAWYMGATLLVSAGIGGAIVRHEIRGAAQQRVVSARSNTYDKADI